MIKAPIEDIKAIITILAITVFIGNLNKAININKVYIIREDNVDLSYHVMLLPEEY